MIRRRLLAPFCLRIKRHMCSELLHEIVRRHSRKIHEATDRVNMTFSRDLKTFNNFACIPESRSTTSVLFGPSPECLLLR